MIYPRRGEAKYPDGTVVQYGALRKLRQLEHSQSGALFPTRITDANGNYITITYLSNVGPEIATITDTLGRTGLLNFHYYYDSVGFHPYPLTAITGPGLGGGTRTLIRLDYTYPKLGRTLSVMTFNRS